MRRTILNEFINKYLTVWVLVHILISFLLNNITALAPDENFYVALFNRSYSLQGEAASVSSWSNSSGLFVTILYFPAYVLHNFGINPLQSLRIESILVSALALKFIWETFPKTYQVSKAKKIVFILLSCIPTVFLWQGLALREGYIFLQLSLIFFFLLKLGEKFQTRDLILVFLVMTSLLFTKDYLYVLVAASISIACAIVILKSRFKNSGASLVILAVILPVVVFIPQSKGIIQSSGIISARLDGTTQGVGKTGATQGVGKTGATQGVGISEIDDMNSIFTERAQIGGGTIHLLNKQLESNSESIFFKLLDVTGIYKQIELLAKSSYAEPQSEIYNQSIAQLSIPGIQDVSVQSLISRAGTFLLVPTLGKDNGSLFLNLQSFELPFWVLLYLLIILSFWRSCKYRDLKIDTLTAYVFIFLFIGISAVTEVNLGTALRHRSILVIPALFLLTQLISGKNRENRIPNSKITT
jgi:hypothetical protein